MTRIELNKEFEIFSAKMNVILEKLNQQYALITEKYGENKAELLLEGFWDTLKAGASKISQAAHAVGKGIGKGVSAVTGAGNWLWNKGVELGQQAKTLITNLATKIEGYIKDAYNWVVSAPGKFMIKMQNMWADLKTNLEQLKTAAGDKFQEVITTISNNISAKIVEPLKAKWAEFQKNYAASKESMKAKAGELKQMGNDFVKSGKEDLVKVGQAILKGTETAGFFIIGLVMLPFYLVFKGSEYLYNIGSSVVQNIKQNAPEVWNALQVREEFKKGYEEGKNPPVKESKIFNFEAFLESKKECCKKCGKKGCKGECETDK